MKERFFEVWDKIMREDWEDRKADIWDVFEDTGDILGISFKIPFSPYILEVYNNGTWSLIDYEND
jgi:hypothetical protein